MARRGVRRANAGAEGINRRQFFAPEGDSDLPSGFVKTAALIESSETKNGTAAAVLDYMLWNSYAPPLLTNCSHMVLKCLKGSR